jgi:hypothetical protein
MRKILCLLLTISISQIGLSQGNFEVKAGTNLYYIHSKTETENFDNPKLGFVIGGAYDMKVSDRFSIQPELLFSTQRSQETYYNNTIKTNYVNLPVLFKFHPVASNFSLYAGPQVSFLSNVKRKVNDQTIVYRDAVNKTDLGGTAGLGYLFPKCRITADVRYYFGTLNVLQDQQSGTKTRNRLWSVMIGYSFAKKK